jgi:hypothetical protein
MSLWEKNRKILDERFPGLADRLLKDDLDPRFRVETGQWGWPVLTADGRHVHSPRDPLREAARLSRAPGKGPAAVFGFGLGYTAEALADRPTVVIVEKHPALIRLALESRDMTGFLSKSRIIFVTGGRSDGITGALELLPEKPVVIKNPVLTALDADWYGQAEALVGVFFRMKEVNEATQKRMGQRLERNIKRNLSVLRDVPGVRLLFGAAPGIPAFVAAAGPSLDDAAQYLKPVRERCIVTAVDTALGFFLRRGIEPDFVVTVDPQYWNFRHFDRCAVQRAALVADVTVYPACFGLPFRRRFLAASSFPQACSAEERADPKGELGAGGSVAARAWDFARSLGASEIWLSGLDLAYPGFRTHFRGAFFEERAAFARTRLEQETAFGPLFSAAAAGGGSVPTSEGLALYGEWFASRFRLFPQVKNRSLSPRGLAIPGQSTAAWEELLALPQRRGEIDQTLEAAFARTGSL